MTTLAVTSVTSLRCHVSTWFRMGSKFRCMRSTPTETQSTSENDFECLASTGVNVPGTMSPDSGPYDSQLAQFAIHGDNVPVTSLRHRKPAPQPCFRLLRVLH